MSSTALQQALEAILARYGRARSLEIFGKKHPIWREFETIAATLKAAPPISTFRSMIVRWSAGQGRWSNVPWISLLDTRETTRSSEGVYVVYLFRADLSGVYLTLNQGTQWVFAGHGDEGATELRTRAEVLRKRCADLSDHGFTVAKGIDLRHEAKLVQGYQISTAAFKLYERGKVPPDEALLSDLEIVLAAYQKVIPSRRIFDLPGETGSMLRDRLTGRYDD